MTVNLLEIDTTNLQLFENGDLEITFDAIEPLTERKTARDLAVSEGQSTLKNTVAKLDEQIAIAKKNDLAVNESTTNNTPQYKDTKGLTGEALKVAMAENIKLYNEAIKASAGLMD